jgi:hypothetical protein
MKRFCIALAIASFGLLGCNDYGNTFQTPTGALITSLSPSDASAGGAAFTLTVNSNGGFVKDTHVLFNGANLTTTFVSSVVVTAQVPASMIASPGSATVETLNPHSGAGTNGLSNPVTFVIHLPSNPVPSITSLTPSSAKIGGAAFPLQITGSSFLPASDPTGGSRVNWSEGGIVTTLVPTAISATQITATVPASLIATAGNASVSVFNPPVPPPPGPNPSPGGGGSSPSLPFTVSISGASAHKSVSQAAPAGVEETPALTADGRYVTFTATQNAHTQIFLRDTCEGAAAGCQSRTDLLSVAIDGTPANDDSHTPGMSADGRFVAFSSAATNLVEGSPAGRQVYRRDTCLGVAGSSCAPSTQLISTDPTGSLVGTESILPSVSASGRFVAFIAVTPSHLPAPADAKVQPVASDKNSGYRQVFVRDTCLAAANCTPKTTRISLHPGDISAKDVKVAGPALSSSGTHIAVPGADTATIFTRSVPVDDRIFLAITAGQP